MEVNCQRCKKYRPVKGAIHDSGDRDSDVWILTLGCGHVRDYMTYGGEETKTLKRLAEGRRVQMTENYPDKETPIPMVLHCPKCGEQHVDEPVPGWENPPHRSHLCENCGCIWRPADVATCGVKFIATKGKSDNWDPSQPHLTFGSHCDESRSTSTA